MAAPAARRVDERRALRIGVVEAVDHHVLEAHPAAGALREALPGVDDAGDRPLAVDGHQLVAQLVGGGMQADRQVHLGQLVDHAVDPRYDTGGADRDAARPDAEPLRVVEEAHRVEHPIRVVERLAHPHEDDVVGRAAVAGPPRRPQRVPRRPVPVQHLVDDLAGAQLAGEARLAGGAEGAADRAPGLRGDADGGALPHLAARRIAHQHRLDALTVVQLVHRLGGQPVVSGQHVARLDGAEAEVGVERGPQRRRHIGQVGEAARVGAMRPGQDLRRPVRGLAAGVEPRGERCGCDLADGRRRAGQGELSHDVRRRATRSTGTSAAR